MNPAYMTRQAHKLTKEEYGVIAHITSLNPIRPENAADKWETRALQAFERKESEVNRFVYGFPSFSGNVASVHHLLIQVYNPEASDVHLHCLVLRKVCTQRGK